MVRRLIALWALVIFNVPNISAQTEEIISDAPMMVLSEGPVFNGDLKKFILDNIQYPASAIRDSVEGRVVVTFIIDTCGLTSSHRIVKSIRKDLDDEALRIARLISFSSPAKQHEKALWVYNYVVPVDFSLSHSNIERPSKKDKGPKKKNKIR